MAGLVREAKELLSIIMKIIQACEQKKQNTSALQYLQTFYRDLNVNLQQLQGKVLRNNSARWALDAVQEDLESAILEANNIWNKGFVRSVWNANKIQSKLQALHERVMTSFQTRLSVASLDVALESKHDQDAFQDAMRKVNKDLEQIFISTSTSIKQDQQLALRRELNQVVQSLTIVMESQADRVESAVSMIRSVQPQTSDAEKFLADVLAALNGVSVKGQGDAASCSAQSSTRALKWYEDRVTWEIMCDPVKANDGFTYNRWTILGKPVDGKLCGGLSKSPYGPQDPFHIFIDDLDVRSRLFHKFPAQEMEFRKCRAAYRNAALHELKLEHFGEAAMMLKHVLQWAPDDLECIEKLHYVQQIIDDDTKLPAREVCKDKQPNPSRLVSARSGTSLLVLSPDGLSCRFRCPDLQPIGAAMADVEVPIPDEIERSTSVFYFEIKIVDQGESVVALGFTGLESFKEDRMPGRYPNSYGYLGKDGSFFGDGNRLDVKHVVGPVAMTGDTMGAGVHHGLNEIFFVHNGSLITSIHCDISGPIMPTVALGLPSADITVAFFAEWNLKERPSRLIVPGPDFEPLVLLSADGLIARFTAAVPYEGAVRANCFAWQQDASQIFYFEVSKVEVAGGIGVFPSILAIGFAHSDCFRKDRMPGSYLNSCGYHGGRGNLFIGNPRMSQQFGPTFSSGDIIGGGIDYASNTIFFTKNGKEVGQTRWLTLSCTLFPVVGLHRRSVSETTVSVNFGQRPFCFNASRRGPPNLGMVEQPNRLLYCSDSAEVFLSKKGLQARYKRYECSPKDYSIQALILPRIKDGKRDRVAALMADPAMCTAIQLNHMRYFELTVLIDGGQKGCIAIGFCRRDVFTCSTMPGWDDGSVGYHGNSGWLVHGGENAARMPSFSTGDIVGAGLDFDAGIVFFVKNGHVLEQIINVKDVRLFQRHSSTSRETAPSRETHLERNSYCPVIALRSTNEEVLLNFGQSPFAWNCELPTDLGMSKLSNH